MALAPWFREREREGAGVFALERGDRLREVQRLADDAMRRVGEIVPVTSVPLVCAAVQTFDAEFISRAALIERSSELRASLLHRGRHVLQPEEDIGHTLDRAYELLRLRRVLARDGEGYVVLPRGRELISYYANSISHLLGEFESAVRARDALPVYAAVDV